MTNLTIIYTLTIRNILTNMKNSIIERELYTIYLLQKYLVSSYIFDIVSYNKYLTSFNSISLYLSIVLYYDIYLFIYIILTLTTSRTTNRYIKDYCKKERPYNRNPGYIQYFIKRKQSYSFPSQSILNISVLYNSIYYYNKVYYENYINSTWFCMISFIYYMLFISLSITRMYRGLHYPHDIIISYLYSIFVVKFIMWLF
jgi:membrane-associated phospholipid phosphatase